MRGAPTTPSLWCNNHLLFWLTLMAVESKWVGARRK
jgi:hypothetical protein